MGYFNVTNNINDVKKKLIRIKLNLNNAIIKTNFKIQ